MKIAIFYHTLFYIGDQLRMSAVNVVREQMTQLKQSGLLDAADQFVVGINGGEESAQLANVLIPSKADITLHGLASRAENLTIVEIEKWVRDHLDWAVLYFHSKGATHEPNSDYGKFAGRWRRCMMNHMVSNWRGCVDNLRDGYEATGCHWMTGLGSDKSQNIFAGNFWWATSDFLRDVPSIFLRDRIKVSGIASLESRYEAEVWIGNGRLPKVKELSGHTVGQCP